MYSLTQVVLKEREELVHQKEVRSNFSRFHTALVEIYTKEFLWGFIPCGFPEENVCAVVLLCFMCLLSLEEISTQNGPFNFYSNSMSSCVSQ